MTYCIGNLGPGLEQTQKCGRVKLIYGIYTLYRENNMVACDTIFLNYLSVYILYMKKNVLG